MDIILFGKQGSGKGTLGAELAKRYNFKVFETGAYLRSLSLMDSALAKKVKAIIESGKLVPTEIVMEIIEDFMLKLEKDTNVLFDGIPRKMDQALAFDNLMKKMGRDYFGLLIEVSDNEAIKRLTSRRICEKCKKVFPTSYTSDICDVCGGKLITRSDDTDQAIRTRLETYKYETMPVIEKLKKENKIVEIKGEQIIEKVFEETITLLDPKFLR